MNKVKKVADKISLDYIIYNSPGHVYWKDVNGIYLGCNANQARSLNLKSPDEIIGRNDYELLYKFKSSKKRQEQAERIKAVDKKVIETGKQIEVEEIEIIGNYTTIYHSKKIPLFNNSKEVIGILGISFDITAEKELQEKQKDENASLSLIAGSIAHDLRTPLAAFSLNFSMIHEIVKELEITDMKADKLNISKLEIIKEVIELSKKQINLANTFIDITLNNLKCNEIARSSYKILDIMPLITEAIALYPFELNQRKLVSVSEEKSFKFLGSDTYFKNVLFNLIKNALFYIEKNQRGTIEIWIQKNNDYNKLNFKDTAEGASQEVVNKMFDNYFSGRKYGTGLGLAFCKSIMKSFGGNITAQSKEGKYMHFTLNFPIIKSRNKN